MPLLTFVGSALLAFSPAIAIFTFEVAPSPQLVILFVMRCLAASVAIYTYILDTHSRDSMQGTFQLASGSRVDLDFGASPHLPPNCGHKSAQTSPSLSPLQRLLLADISVSDGPVVDNHPSTARQSGVDRHLVRAFPGAGASPVLLLAQVWGCLEWWDLTMNCGRASSYFSRSRNGEPRGFPMFAVCPWARTVIGPSCVAKVTGLLL